MANLYLRKGSQFIWIKWYDKNQHKSCYASTKFKDTPSGMKKAKEFKREFESELISRHRQSKLGTPGIITLQDAFAHYLKNNADKNLKTIAEYKNWFEKFKKYFPENGAARKLNKMEIESFLNNVKTFKVQQNTKYNICKNTKKFLGFLFEYNYAVSFVINKDVLTKPQIKEKIIFTEKDYKLIFDHLDEQTHNLKLAIYLLTYSGLRPSDILKINSNRIYIENETFAFYSEKGKRFKTVPIHSKLLPILINRIEEIEHGELLEYKSIDIMGQAMRRYFKRLKLDKKGYNLRTFRKTFDSYGYENGMEPMSAAELLGHSAAVAQRNYRKISMKRMKNELEKFQIHQDIPSINKDGKLVNFKK